MPQLREHDAGRPRHHLPRRAGPGEDEDDPLTGLLDEWMPIVAGSEINDDPYQPVSRYARELVAEHGEATPITWVHRDDRYGEKLAAPDVDRGPDRRGRSHQGRRRALLSDELTLRYGLIPRTNTASSPSTSCRTWPSASRSAPAERARGARRPDPRLQDPPPARRRARRVRQPDDYTNRGRIITPLKDRWQPDPHALPARGGHRGRDHAPGARPGAVGDPCACRATWRRSWPRSPSRPQLQPRQSALGRVRAPVGVERRGPGQLLIARCGREKEVVPGQRPRGSGLLDLEEDRDRDPRGGSRGPDRREHDEGETVLAGLQAVPA